MRIDALGAQDSTAGRHKVFLHYDQEELDRAYNQRVWAPNWQTVLGHFRHESDAVRAGFPGLQDVAYAAGPTERLHVFPTAQAGAPVHIHIHGGAWRNLRKEDVSFPARALTAAGMAYVVPDFSPLPDVRLPDVIDQLARAVAWVYRHAQEFGASAERIFLSGHSSGAQLCSVLLTVDWPAYGLPADVIKGALCVSGIYDLAPVVLSARGEYVKLTAEEVRRLSIVHHAASVPCPVMVAWAEGDSPEFVRQSLEFIRALRDSGRTCEAIEIPGCNHYEIVGKIPELALALSGLRT